MDIIELCFRGETVFMTRGDITGLVKEDWFLSILSGNEYWNDPLLKRIEVNEDKKTAMSIIETMRHNDLIVLNDVSINYMLKLGEKWCIPECFLELIREEKNKPKEKNSALDNMVFSCINCQSGFKLYENTRSSCKTHRYSFNSQFGGFSCCGSTDKNDHCIIGYHVLSTSDKDLIQKLS